MATYGWRKTVAVKRALFDEGHRFGFFQAVRLLEAIFPDRTGPGEGMEPEREVVRFRSRVGFDFPASEVDAIREPRGGDSGEPAEMTVSILGLAGVQGPLPTAVTEAIVERAGQGDHALGAFLDLFNHRLVGLLYRARKKHRPACTNRPPDEGRVARCLLALIGLGTPALQGRTAVPDRSLLRYTGLLTPHPRSMVGLERMLADHFGVPVEIVPFRGRWLDIEEEDRTRIGQPGPRGGGNNNRLGEGAVLGSRFWDQTAAFEVRLGPLALSELLDLLPVGNAYGALIDLARFYVDDQYEIDVRLACRAEEVPELRLGEAGDVRLGWSSRLHGAGSAAEPRIGSAGGARLGWTTWLGGAGTGEDAALPGTAASVLLREAS